VPDAAGTARTEVQTADVPDPATRAAGPSESPSPAPQSPLSELAKRTLFTVVAAPVTVGVVIIGGPALAVLLAAVAAVAARELYRLARAGGVQPIEAVGIPLAAALPLVTALQPRGVFTISPGLAAGALLLVFTLAIWLRPADRRPLSAVATTLFGAFYTGGLLSFGLAIRYHRFVADDRGGVALVLLPVLLTWATDIGAYVIGRLLGRRKLIPAVSPGKTIAGAIGGVAVSVGVCWLYVGHMLRPVAQLGMAPETVVLFAVAISIAAQLGDLAESLLKREAGVKNSSTLIPGHGGMLDRLDSLLFVLPVAYVLFSMPGILLPVPTVAAR
jgi:phosphatidate cytidylyltransferase